MLVSMKTVNNTIRECAAALKLYDSYVITAHINPDGDAYGSMVAMACILQKLGKSCVLYNATEVAGNLTNLRHPFLYYTDVEALYRNFTPEALIVLDISTPKRMGALYEVLDTLPSFNIDHHAECEAFASVINIIDSSAAATGCIVASIAKELCISYDGLLGEALYLSITSDTGNFVNANTDAFSFHCAGEICAAGLSVEDFAVKYRDTWSMEKMRFWGYALANVATHYDGAVLIFPITFDLLERFAITKEDTEGLNNFLLTLATAKLVILLYEVTIPYVGIKLSIRAKKMDALPLAKSLGGGGHNRACGVFLEQYTLEQAMEVLHKQLDMWYRETVSE